MIAPAELDAILAVEGLERLGAAPLGRDAGFDARFRSAILVGPKPEGFWAVFSAAPEAADGAAHPLDRWSLRVGDALAARLDLGVAYPFGGPPYQPFLAWALASGRFFASPIGPLVHERRGLWASFRFALLSPAPAERGAGASPCEGCAAPCKTACPVGAFAGGFDAAACAGHAGSDAGRACRETGCLARAACPAGRGSAPEPERAALHMAAFLAARRGAAV